MRVLLRGIRPIRAMVDTEVCRPILERMTHSGEDGVLLPEWVFMSDVAEWIWESYWNRS